MSLRTQQGHLRLKLKANRRRIGGRKRREAPNLSREKRESRLNAKDFGDSLRDLRRRESNDGNPSFFDSFHLYHCLFLVYFVFFIMYKLNMNVEVMVCLSMSG